MLVDIHWICFSVMVWYQHNYETALSPEGMAHLRPSLIDRRPSYMTRFSTDPLIFAHNRLEYLHWTSHWTKQNSDYTSLLSWLTWHYQVCGQNYLRNAVSKNVRFIYLLRLLSPFELNSSPLRKLCWYLCTRIAGMFMLIKTYRIK